jgi:hypothetical protein
MFKESCTRVEVLCDLLVPPNARPYKAIAPRRESSTGCQTLESSCKNIPLNLEYTHLAMCDFFKPHPYGPLTYGPQFTYGARDTYIDLLYNPLYEGPDNELFIGK